MKTINKRNHGDFETLTSLVSLLDLRAENQTEKGFYFFKSRENAEFWNFTVLAEKARSIAAELQQKCRKRERVLLFYPPGLDYVAAFFGCLYAGVISVPVYPPRNNRNFERLDSIIQSSGAVLALTNQALFKTLEQLFKENEKYKEIRVIATDEINDDARHDFNEIDIKPDDIAFLQYTSGSTSQPRGVIVKHENLMHNSALMKTAFNYDSESRCVSWLPMYHDMGLIGSIIQPLYGGYSCSIFSSANFLQTPLKWLQLLSDQKATISGSPNFGYELCVKKISYEEIRDLDLSSWKVAFNGAEPLRSETMKAFSEKFAKCGFNPRAFFPCYGLAEATLFVSGGQAGEGIATMILDAGEFEKNNLAIAEKAGAGQKEFVSSGKIYPSQQSVKIVNYSEKKEAGENEIGEIWINGKSVADGYWNNQEETEKIFRAGFSDSNEKYLATGDLGFIKNGRLFVTGRIKDLIIVRGVNHYPQDIEQTVLNLDSTLLPNSCAAFSINENNEESLIIILEIRHPKKFNFESLKENINRAISFEHGIEPREIVFTKPNAIPKTTSGKIQRYKCRELFINKLLPVITSKENLPENLRKTEKAKLYTVFSQKTLKNPLYADLVEWISKNPRFEHSENRSNGNELFDGYVLNGLDSLKSLELLHLFEKNGQPVGFSEIEESATLADLLKKSKDADKLSEKSFNENGVNLIAENAAPLLSYGQKGFWFRHQLYLENSPDNIFIALRDKGNFNAAIFQKALNKIVARHEILRTHYLFEQNELKSRVLPFSSPNWEIVELTGNEPEIIEKISRFAHEKFKIEEETLFQIRLYQINGAEKILLLKFHHSIIDLWSVRIIAAELDFYYQVLEQGSDREIPLPKARYADFARWQNEFAESEKGKRSLNFWKSKLNDDLPILSFPLSKKGQNEQGFSGDKIDFKFNDSQKNALEQFCRKHQTTLFNVLLASYFAVLYRLTEQPEQIIGTPFSGRTSSKWSDVVGYFVNLLPLRLKINECDGFLKIQKTLEKETFGAKKHQDYPFHLLVEKLQPQRIAGKSPVFQTMFVFQNKIENDSINLLSPGAKGGQIRFGNARFETVALKTFASQFELSLHISETRDEIVGKFEFDTGVFEKPAVENLCRYWLNLLEQSIVNPFMPIGFLQILDQNEINGLTDAARENYFEVPPSKRIQDFFAEQAEKTPEAVAVSAGDENLTYRELNERAEILADYLSKNGISAEKLVGICLPRTADLLVAILAVFKAGGAYVPLDANYPAERLEYIAEDSGIAALITRKVTNGNWSEKIAKKIFIEEIGFENDGFVPPPVRERGSQNNLAYIIYTSGSTGVPKGVAIEHKSVVAFLEWCLKYFEAGAFSKTLASTSLNFDLSVFELLAPLSCGGTVVITENALFLPEVMKNHEISLVNTVPSAISELVKTNTLPPKIKTINLAGEPLPKSLADALYDKFGVEKVINLYGPSEDTTYSTVELIERNDEKVTIGLPVANTKIYLLNNSLQLVPEGFTGEIYISGKGLARGYFGKPEMTAERFLPDPFAEIPGERIYKTGDNGRFLSDGKLEYLGRSDSQIKIRGFRIELGEIETVLLKHPAVSEAVVTTVEMHRGIIQLACFLVLKDTEKSEFSLIALKSSLRTKLPEYMIPQYFSILESLPLTPNGKIDRTKLQKHKFEPTAYNHFSIAPQTPVEIALAEIWKEVLKLEKVGVESNFFEMGGTSIHLMQIASRIKELYPGEFAMRKFFNSFTIKEQAEQLAANPSDKSATKEADEIKPIARSTRKAVVLTK